MCIRDRACNQGGAVLPAHHRRGPRGGDLPSHLRTGDEIAPHERHGEAPSRISRGGTRSRAIPAARMRRRPENLHRQPQHARAGCRNGIDVYKRQALECATLFRESVRREFLRRVIYHWNRVHITGAATAIEIDDV